MINACFNAGLPEPTIEEVAGGFQITFLKDIYSEAYLKRLGLSERQIKAFKYVKSKGKITNKEYQKINDCSRNTASGDLSNLVEMKILKPSNIKGAGSFYEIN